MSDFCQDCCHGDSGVCYHCSGANFGHATEISNGATCHNFLPGEDFVDIKIGRRTDDMVWHREDDWDAQVDAQLELERVETRKLELSLAQERVEGRVQVVAQTKGGSVPVHLYLMDDGSVEWSRHAWLRRSSGQAIDAPELGRVVDEPNVP